MIIFLLIMVVVLSICMPLIFIYGFNTGVKSKSGEVIETPNLIPIPFNEIIKKDIEIDFEEDNEGYTAQELSLMQNMLPPEKS